MDVYASHQQHRANAATISSQVTQATALDGPCINAAAGINVANDRSVHSARLSPVNWHQLGTRSDTRRAA